MPCTFPQQKVELLLCREKLVAQGRSNVDAVRHGLEREQKVNEIKAVRLKAACWDTMAVPEAKILPVGQTSLTSGLADYAPTDEMSTRFAAGTLAPVSNMPIRKLSEAETQRLQEVCTPHKSGVECVPLTEQLDMAVLCTPKIFLLDNCTYRVPIQPRNIVAQAGVQDSLLCCCVPRGVCLLSVNRNLLTERRSVGFCLSTAGAVPQAGGV